MSTPTLRAATHTHRPARRSAVAWARTLRLFLVFALACLGVLSPALSPSPALAHAIDDAPQQTSPPPAAPTPLAAQVPAFRAAKRIAVITIADEIDAARRTSESVMVRSVDRRIAAAVRAGADAIVFELDTPGGEVGASLRIADAIKECPIKNTVAWVHPRAMSGGAIIALACREIVVSEGAAFGDAMPITFGRKGPRAVSEPEMLKKVLPPLITSVVDSARRRNESLGTYERDEYLSQAIIANDVELWWARHKPTGAEVAITRAEFEILFPNADPNTPARLAGLLGQQAEVPLDPAPPADATPGASTPSSATASPAGIESASKKIASVSDEVQQNWPQALRSMRPPIRAEERADWELIEKVLNGTAPATFGALDMARYKLADNRAVGADGRTVLKPIYSDEDLKAYFGATELIRLNSSWSEGLVAVLTHPVARGVLIAIFLIALFIEMSHPGAIVAGVVSLLALAALLAPPMLIGLASWWEIAAILVGIVLIGIEAFALPGFGLVGVLGLILLFAGLLGTFLPQGASFMPRDAQGQSQLLWGASTILAALLTSGIAIYFIAKHLGSVPILNKFVLRDPALDENPITAASPVGVEATAIVGELGVTITPLRPSGKVDVGGRVIDATSESSFLQAQTRVRVTSVEGIRVLVEAV